MSNQPRPAPASVGPDRPLGRRAQAAVERRRVLLRRRLGLYIVADGMGGHAAGEVASQEAVETVYGMVKRGHRRACTSSPIPWSRRTSRAASRLMESAIQAATYMVFSMAEIDRGKTGWARPSARCSSSASTPSPRRSATAASTGCSGDDRRTTHGRSHAHRVAVEARSHHPAGGEEVASPERRSPARSATGTTSRSTPAS